MLGQEIYGPLTQKQREYVEIVHNSSKELMDRVKDIVELGLFDPSHELLEFTPVDVEMLGQQVVSTLNQLASQRTQTLAVSIEPGERVWVLDRSLVKQILYHTVIQRDAAGWGKQHYSGPRLPQGPGPASGGMAVEPLVRRWTTPVSGATVSGHDPKTYLSRWRIADWLPHAPGLAWVILPISAGA